MIWRVIALLLALTGGASAQVGIGTQPNFTQLQPAPSGGGSVIVDIIGTTKYQATSNSFSYTGLTTGTPPGLGLVCMLLREHASNDVTAGVAMTWNGVSMSLRESQTGGGGAGTTRGAFLFGLHNPASGAQTLAVSATNVATDNFVNCVSFSNVNQTSDALAFPNPTGAINSTSVSVTSASGHIAVGAFQTTGGLGTILGTIVISDNSSGSVINAGADYVASVGASTTVGTSSNQDNIAGMDVSN